MVGVLPQGDFSLNRLAVLKVDFKQLKGFVNLFGDDVVEGRIDFIEDVRGQPRYCALGSLYEHLRKLFEFFDGAVDHRLDRIKRIKAPTGIAKPGAVPGTKAKFLTESRRAQTVGIGPRPKTESPTDPSGGYIVRAHSFPKRALELFDPALRRSRGDGREGLVETRPQRQFQPQYQD